MQRSETIPIEEATSAGIDISMAVGMLRFSGGASELMDADFTYDDELQPLISHSVDNGLAVLNIRQDSQRKLRTTRNEWDLRFNSDLPLGLHAGVAAADASLSLDNLTLTALDVSSAAGDAEISAGGEQPRLETVSVDTASGDVQLTLNGSYPAASSVSVSSAAGDVELDLSGQWGRDVEVSVDTVAGDVRINVPASVGVSVRSTSMVSRVKLDGFQRAADGQVNSAHGSAPVTLRLKITTISGGVTVTEVR